MRGLLCFCFCLFAVGLIITATTPGIGRLAQTLTAVVASLLLTAAVATAHHKA